MAKKGYLYICNRCGQVIDTENDIDCVETMMFRQRNIGECVAEDDVGRKFHKVDSGGRLHFCGKCSQMLMSHYVFGHEYKKPPIAEELVRCEDCVHRLMSDCPLCYIEKQKLCFIDMRGDFFCGYGERKADSGTALRNIVLSLTAPTEKAAGVMADLGLQVFDSDGQMRPMVDILADLNGALEGMERGEEDTSE